MASEGAQATPLIERYQGIICDLDGVAYRGRDAVPDASAALAAVIDRGMPVVFATNNASRPPGEVSAQLRELGIPATPEAVLTSSQASAAYLAREFAPGTKVLAVGGHGVADALTEAGLVPVAEGASDVAAVLQGYGPDVTAADLAEAAHAVTRGVRWVATNGDLTLPHEWGFGPGCGALLATVTIATGKHPDAVIGKPHPPLYLEAARRMALAPSAILAIGDRLDTDIDGAAAADMDSVFVLTGVDSLASLVATPERAVPTYVMTTLVGLLRPYAVPARDGASWECDGSRVSLSQNGAGLTWQVSEASGDDPWRLRNGILRAGLAALLERRAAGGDLAALADAAQRLQTGT